MIYSKHGDGSGSRKSQFDCESKVAPSLSAAERQGETMESWPNFCQALGHAEVMTLFSSSTCLECGDV